MINSNVRLSEFSDKYVDVCVNGKTYTHWYAILYESAADNDDTEECIGIVPSKEIKGGTWFYRSEIESIKLSENQVETTNG